MLTRILLMDGLLMRTRAVQMGKQRKKWWGKRRRWKMSWRGTMMQQNRNFTFNDLK